MNNQKPRKGARKLVINKKIWWFRISQAITIEIWSPDGKKHITDGPKVTGRSWYEFGGQFKKNDGGTVFPADIREYIEIDSNLMD